MTNRVASLREDVETGKVGQAEIQNDYIGLVGRGELQRLAARRRLRDDFPSTVSLDGEPHECPEATLIVDDENSTASG